MSGVQDQAQQIKLVFPRVHAYVASFSCKLLNVFKYTFKMHRIKALCAVASPSPTKLIIFAQIPEVAYVRASRPVPSLTQVKYSTSHLSPPLLRSCFIVCMQSMRGHLQSSLTDDQWLNWSATGGGSLFLILGYTVRRSKFLTYFRQ